MKWNINFLSITLLMTILNLTHGSCANRKESLLSVFGLSPMLTLLGKIQNSKGGNDRTEQSDKDTLSIVPCPCFLIFTYHDSLLEPKPKINTFVLETAKILMETGNTRSLTWSGSLLSAQRRCEVTESVVAPLQHLLLEESESSSGVRGRGRGRLTRSQ